MKKCKKELALNKINKTIRSLAKKKTADENSCIWHGIGM
jgi:hypothetical protein